MENKEIIQQLKLTASLMELHDENPFKLRSYSTAAFNLEKFQTPLELLPLEELEKIEGVGKSMASHIREIVDHKIYNKLQELLKDISTIVMTPTDITIKSVNITVKATGTLLLESPMTDLKGTGVLTLSGGLIKIN